MPQLPPFPESDPAQSRQSGEPPRSSSRTVWIMVGIAVVVVMLVVALHLTGVMSPGAH